MKLPFIKLTNHLYGTWILEPTYRHYILEASQRVPDKCLVLTRYVIVDVTFTARMLNRKLQ